MLEAITEESQEFFNLLIRIEKATLPQLIDKSLSVEIQHIQQYSNSKISSKQSTELVPTNNLIWMKDFFYYNVNALDRFALHFVNEHSDTIALKQVSINQFMPYLNTGEIVKHTVVYSKKNDATAELYLSLSLFDIREPMAGIFPLELSLVNTNQAWAKQEPLKQSETKKYVESQFCPCFTCEKIEGFNEAQFSFPIQPIKK